MSVTVQAKIPPPDRKMSLKEVLSIALRISRRNWSLLVPLVLVELCGLLLWMVPMTWLALAFVRDSASFLRNPLAPLEFLTDGGFWSLQAVGLLLALVGGWLLRTVARAGVIGTLAADLEGATLSVKPQEPFIRTLLDHPERWLVAGAGASLLRIFGFLSGVGAVAASMLWFTSAPGVGPALAMTISTFMLICVPVLDAALGLGFAHSVLSKEGGFSALGEGTLHAARRARVVGPVWYLFVLMALIIALVPTSGASVVTSTLNQGLGGAVAAAMVDLSAWLLGAVLAAFVVLWRLGAWTVLAVEELRSSEFRAARDLSELVVLDAVVISPDEK